MEQLENVPGVWPDEAQELLGANILKPAVCCCEGCQTTLALFREQATASCFQLACKDYLEASQSSLSRSLVFHSKETGPWGDEASRKQWVPGSRSQLPPSGSQAPSRWTSLLPCQHSWLPVALRMLS